MALILPSPGWAYCTTNLSGTPPTASVGTTVTPGVSNANGTTTALISAITHDVELLYLAFNGYVRAAVDNSTQCDIMIDPAGGTSWSTTPLIADLIIGGCSAQASTVMCGNSYFFPIFIKSGSSIGARIRQSHTVAAASPRVVIKAYGGHANPSQWWCGQVVQAIGTTAASSAGTAHTAGNSGAYSAWTNFGSTTSYNGGAVQWGLQSQLSALTALGYYFEFGAGSTRIGPNIYAVTTTGEALTRTETGPIFCSIPAGTQLQVRGTCSGTAEATDVAAYIVS